MIEMVVKGGWVMAPILLGSVVALSLVLERMWYFFKISLDTEEFSKKILKLARENRRAEAVAVCSKTNHPLSAVFKAGLEHADEELSAIDRVMEREGNRQIQKTEENLNFLVVVIGVEPLLGFLGTILGLIQAFMTWEKLASSVTVSVLAAGIYQAMITTAAGLIIAIPYFVIYNIFLSKVNRITNDLNHYGDELVGILSQRHETADAR